MKRSRSVFVLALATSLGVLTLLQASSLMPAIGQDLPFPFDVGCTEIQLPAVVSAGDTVTPTCLVYNYGDSAASYMVRLKIGTFYDTVAAVSGHSSLEIKSVSFPTWTPGDTGTFIVTCSTELSGDGQPANDRRLDTVTVGRTSAPPGWTKLRDVSGHPSGKAVKGGGGITAMGDAIYLILGNNTKEFLRYTFAGNSWTSLCTLPTGPKNKKVKKGATIVDDETFVYVLKGGGTKEFYRYATTSNSWEECASPGFDKGAKGASAAFVEYGGERYIYALSGSSNSEWKRFNIGTGGWEAPTPPTLPVEKAKVGSSLVYDGLSKLYFMVGGSKENQFFVNDLASDEGAWRNLTSLPNVQPGVSSSKKKMKEGGCLDWFRGRVFAVKGGSTRQFWVYTAARDSWAYVGEVGDGATAKGIKCGRALTASEHAGGVYLVVGNNTNEFWQYGLPLMDDRPGEPSVATQARAGALGSLRIPALVRGPFSVACSPKDPRPAHLAVYNALGQCVYTARSAAGALSVGALPPGSYVLRLEAGGETWQARFVVAR